MANKKKNSKKKRSNQNRSNNNANRNKPNNNTVNKNKVNNNSKPAAKNQNAAKTSPSPKSKGNASAVQAEKTGNIFVRFRNWFRKNKAIIWDKFTTGLLIALMCSPIIILGYIFYWFMSK